MYYPSGYFRRKARAVLKGRWQTALLVTLIVNLPSLMMQGISAFTGNDAAVRLQAFMTAASRDGILTRETLLNEIQALLESTPFWTIRGLELLAWLITPCLTLGMYKWILDRLAGLDDPVSTVFSRMKLFLKAIGLQLMIILKVFLWMLPGLAAYAVAMIPVFRAAGPEKALSALQGVYAISLPLILLVTVPAVIAALRYALAEFIMADDPDNKIMFCIRRSKFLMKEQKRNLFLLMLTFLLWYLLSMLVSSVLSGVFSLVVQMLASLAISVYMATSVGAFYLRLEERDIPDPVPGSEDEGGELN